MPGYGLTCAVSGVEDIIKPKTVTDKNRKNLTVKISGVVIDESADADPTSVISGSDNGKVALTPTSNAERSGRKEKTQKASLRSSRPIASKMEWWPLIS